MLKTQPVNSHWFTVSSTMLSVGFILQWIFCLNLICRTRLAISGLTICFYIKLSRDLFEINDFVQYQSRLLPSLQLPFLPILLWSPLIDLVCWLCKDQRSKSMTISVWLMLCVWFHLPIIETVFLSI